MRAEGDALRGGEAAGGCSPPVGTSLRDLTDLETRTSTEHAGKVATNLALQVVGSADLLSELQHRSIEQESLFEFLDEQPLSKFSTSLTKIDMSSRSPVVSTTRE